MLEILTILCVSAFLAFPESAAMMEDTNLTLNPLIRCQQEKDPRIRTFNSMQEYENSDNSFELGSAAFQGNYVNFNFNLSRLRSNHFKSNDSRHIIKLFLENKNIKGVDDNAFRHLDCLKYLDLQRNHIGKLGKHTFYFLGRLIKLNMSYNQLETFEDEQLYHQKHLEVLDLSHNRIKTVGNSAFINLVMLKRLDLGYNDLLEVSTETLSNTPNLERLNLNNNKIRSIHPGEWKRLEQLTFLDLGENLLHNFSLSGNSRLEVLSDIILSNNHIKILDLSQHTFRSISMNNNSFYCDDLRPIVNDLLGRKVEIKGAREFTRDNYMGIDCIEIFRKAPAPAEATPADREYAYSKKYSDLEGTLRKWEDRVNNAYWWMIFTARTAAVVISIDIIWHYKQIYKFLLACYTGRRRRAERAARPQSISPPNFSNESASVQTSPSAESPQSPQVNESML